MTLDHLHVTFRSHEREYYMPTDYPRAEIMRLAELAIARHGGPERARVHFKFTCEACGARCTFEEPNQLFEEGECDQCQHMTPVRTAGFSLLLTTGALCADQLEQFLNRGRAAQQIVDGILGKPNIKE